MRETGLMAVERQAVRPLRVVIADDHTAYREGLARLLRESGIEVVGEAPDGETAVKTAAAAAPDVVVLDLSMPVLSGLEATRRLADHESRVLILSVSAEGSDVTDAISAGASGYVLKDEPVEEVIAGIQAAARPGGRRVRGSRDLRATLDHGGRRPRLRAQHPHEAAYRATRGSRRPRGIGVHELERKMSHPTGCAGAALVS
jgi:DNA-binding NarL/FixJ family response regulator